MKCVRGLSSVALVSFLSIQSGVAMSKVAEQAPNPTLSTQTQPMIIANPLGIIRDTIRTIDQVDQIRLREQRRQEAERRRQELEAARREATEQQRLEAEQRRQYFESLSPEEKEAYLAEQRARQEQADKTAALFLLMLFSGGADSGTAQQDGTCRNTRALPDGEGGVYYETLTPETARAAGILCN